MKKILISLLVLSSVSAFAQVGDSGKMAPTPGSILSTLGLATQYQQMYVSDSNKKNKELIVTYISFSNSKDKFIADNFNNINKVYMSTNLYYNNHGSRQATNVSLYLDRNGMTNGLFYSADQANKGMPLNIINITNIDFIGLERRLVGDVAPEGNLTRVSVSRDSYNIQDMVGFVYKGADSQCTEYMIGTDYSLIGKHPASCFDI